MESSKQEKEQNVSDSPKLTSVQSQSTNTTSQSTEVAGTLSKSTPELFQTSICSAVGSLAKHFQSLAREADLKILAELFSLKSQGLHPLKDLHFCSWKTSKDFSVTIMGEPLEQSSQPFLIWGTFSNGRYLTARISEFHKIGKGCSLSDILEESVEDKYFLSKKIQDRLILGSLGLRKEKIAQDSERATKYIQEKGLWGA